MNLQALRPSTLLLTALALAVPAGAEAQVIKDPGDGRTGGLASTDDALAPLKPIAKLPDSNPVQEAIDAYNRGLGYSDKARKLEEQAAAAEGAKAAKKAAKAQKAYRQAIEQFREALEHAPEFYQAFGGLGYALLRTRQYEEALEAYDWALAIGPRYPEAIEERGEAYLGLGRTEEVKGVYMELLEIDREVAADLMSAMKIWLEEPASDAGELSAEALEGFAAWIDERSEAVASAAEDS